MIIALLILIYFLMNNKNRLPVEGRVTSKFGTRLHPVTKQEHFHNGIDIAANEGTAVRSPFAGKVVNRYTDARGGNQLVIEHMGGLRTGYAHLQDFNVKQGDNIKSGQIIGWVGSTGAVTGAHLHFTVKLNGTPIDPLSRFFAWFSKDTLKYS